MSCLYLGDEEHTRETIINFFTDNRIDWFLVFGLLCRHTASNPITAEMHTSGVRSPEAPDRIGRHSRTGPRTLQCCFKVNIRLRKYTNNREIQ